MFEDRADFRFYLDLLTECAAKYRIEIWAYCLMPNHVHFVCVPRTDAALARGFNTLHMRYAQYFHGKRGLTGHLWMGRFLSCMLDDRGVFEEVRYIENNPVRARLVANAGEYEWSSAQHHISGVRGSLINDPLFLKDTIKDWTAYLAARGDSMILERNWRCLKTGRPSGDPEWVHHLETVLARRLCALPRGRPKKRLLAPEVDSKKENTN